MGVYMSTPVTDKVSEDKKCDRFTYGASSMQGWRTFQEDAHNCLPDFDVETNTSLFAVYDGHGGAAVAKYCSIKLPDFIKNVEKYKTNELSVALQEAFIGFDEVLTHESVIKELKVLAGDDDSDDEDEETDAIAVRKEADMLCEEADMPIEELRAKYSGNPLLQQNKHLKAQKQPSPLIKAKRSKAMTGNGATTESIKEQLDLKVENEHPDNDNNLNTEKELKETSSQNDTQVDKSNSNSKSDLNESSEAAVSSTSECTDDVGKSAESKVGSEVSNDAVSTSSKDNDSTPVQSAEAGSSSSGCSSGPSSSVSSSSGSSGISSEAASSISSGSGEGASSSGSAGSSQSGCSSSGVDSGSGEPGSSGVSGSGKKSGMTLADLDGDDLDSDSEDTSDEDEEYNSDDYEDVEDEEDEEEEEGPGLFGYAKQFADQPDEEQGSDSGCTAVLALLRDKELFVANAGDSRCVLCRDGKAVDLSFDHKPEDKQERDRIEAAGGQVTEDGRVNGGLNLSRALGDHYYKRNETKEPKDQMISAFPDIECTTIGDKDEFLVLACDGIWNSMTSQECVDYVRERLADTKKFNKPSLICEEMFEHCLAPNTIGDGTGCDNMTCIIVVFNQKDTNNTKHDLDSSGSSEPPGKRQRTDEDVVS